jgi:hypothetical protein
MVAEPDDALDERLDEGRLESVGAELALLIGIGDEAHLDEQRRHVRADEDAERRGLIGTRSRSAPSTACANTADCSM